MKVAKNKFLIWLGCFEIICWSFDFINSAVIKNDYSWILWYSTAGLLLSGIALIIQNIKLIYSLFCALFAVETLWVASVFYVLISQQNVQQLAAYLSVSNFQLKDLYVIFYHALIPACLLIAVVIKKESYKYGWVGASFFATTVAILSYFFLSPHSQVNCVHSVNYCLTFFSFLSGFGTPERIMVGLVVLIIFVFIPTSYITIFFKERKQRIVSTSSNLRYN